PTRRPKARRADDACGRKRPRGRLHQQACLAEGCATAAGSRTDRPPLARLGASRHTDSTRYRSAVPAAMATALELSMAAGNEIAKQRGTHLDGRHGYTVRLGAGSRE